jgi:7,8-dihydro-6-hydroxymethylpterin-pyrophosphokinase
VIPAYVAFGANLGEPVETLRSAAVALRRRPGVALVAGSPVYRTPDLVLGGRRAGDWLAGLEPQGVEPTGVALM